VILPRARGHTPGPRHEQVKNLTGFSHGIGTPIGSVDDTQLWGADIGVLR